MMSLYTDCGDGCTAPRMYLTPLNYPPEVVVVQLLSRVWLLATPWTAARSPPCPSLSPSLLKLMSIESVTPSISSSAAPLTNG